MGISLFFSSFFFSLSLFPSSLNPLTSLFPPCECSHNSFSSIFPPFLLFHTVSLYQFSSFSIFFSPLKHTVRGRPRLLLHRIPKYKSWGNSSSSSFVMAESKREKQRSIWRRERENGEKRRNVCPVTVINWDPHEFNPDLNLAWIQKQAKG